MSINHPPLRVQLLTQLLPLGKELYFLGSLTTVYLYSMGRAMPVGA